jgi:chemotaxis protein CheC
MNSLSERHFDALSKIIRDATNLAVHGLSEVIGESVQTPVLNIELIDIEKIESETLLLKDKNFGVLIQSVTGPVNGGLMLLFAQESVQHIVQKMLGAEVDIETVQEYESEAMQELGNIMMNAYLSSLADVFHTPIDSTVPYYINKTQDDVAQHIKNDEKAKFILTSHLALSVDQRETEVKIFFLISAATLENIASKIDKLAEV